MGKKCCNGQSQAQSNSIDPQIMMMMMQMMQQSSNPNDALSRVVDRLDQNGQYSPAMQNYLGNVLQSMPTQPNVAPLPAPTAPNPVLPTTSLASLPANMFPRNFNDRLTI